MDVITMPHILKSQYSYIHNAYRRNSDSESMKLNFIRI